MEVIHHQDSLFMLFELLSKQAKDETMYSEYNALAAAANWAFCLLVKIVISLIPV